MLSDAQVALLREKSFGAVATLRKDGMPHTSLVWLDTDGEHVRLQHEDDPRQGVEGTAELQLGGAADHMHELSRKYTGEDWSDVSDRVIVRVKPERVFGYDV